MSAYALVYRGQAGEAVAVTIPTCRLATAWEIRIDLRAWMEGVLTTVRRQDDPGLKHSADEGAVATYRELQNTDLVARLEGSQERGKYWAVYSFPPEIGPIQDESAGLLFALKFAEELAQQAGRERGNFSYAATGIIRSEPKGRIDPVGALPEKLDAALAKLQSDDKLFYPPPDALHPSERARFQAAWPRIKARADAQSVHLCPVHTVREALVELGILPPLEVRILTPGPGSTVPHGKPICLQGEATDVKEGSLMDSSLVWSSQRDGQLGTGPTLRTTGLSRGAHTITLTATNARRDSATAAVPIRVQRQLSRFLKVAVAVGLLATLILVGLFLLQRPSLPPDAPPIVISERVPELKLGGSCARPGTTAWIGITESPRLPTGTRCRLQLTLAGVEAQVYLVHNDGSTLRLLVPNPAVAPALDNPLKIGQHELQVTVGRTLGAQQLIAVAFSADTQIHELRQARSTLEQQLHPVAPAPRRYEYTGQARDALLRMMQALQRKDGVAYETLSFEHILDVRELAQQARAAMHQCRYAEAGRILETALGADPGSAEAQRLLHELQEAVHRELTLRVSFIYQARHQNRYRPPAPMADGVTLSPGSKLKLYVEPLRDCSYISLRLSSGLQLFPNPQSSLIENALRASKSYWIPSAEGVQLKQGSGEERLCLIASKGPLPDTHQLQALTTRRAALALRPGEALAVPSGTGKDVLVPSVVIQGLEESVVHCLAFRITEQAPEDIPPSGARKQDLPPAPPPPVRIARPVPTPPKPRPGSTRPSLEPSQPSPTCINLPTRLREKLAKGLVLVSIALVESPEGNRAASKESLRQTTELTRQIETLLARDFQGTPAVDTGLPLEERALIVKALLGKPLTGEESATLCETAQRVAQLPMFLVHGELRITGSSCTSQVCSTVHAFSANLALEVVRADNLRERAPVQKQNGEREFHAKGCLCSAEEAIRDARKDLFSALEDYKVLVLKQIREGIRELSKPL